LNYLKIILILLNKEYEKINTILQSKVRIL